MPNLYDPVDVLTNAIFGQESDWNPNAKTSVTGARGIGQIQPQTFAQYAYPGENINNATDNAAVGRRIISDYYNKYGFDPARIATAYFSGQGNVAPPNSATPYLQDRSDPTGKRTSSYVRDVTSRVSKLASKDQPVSANDILSSFEQASPTKPAASVSGDDILTQFKSANVQPNGPINGSFIPVPPTTPKEIADWNARVAATRALGQPSWLAENYHPLAAIPQTVGSGIAQLSKVIPDVKAGMPASAVGDLVGGAINTVGGPLIGPYNETFRAAGQAIGNPQAADVLSLVGPTKGIGGAAKTALIPGVRAGSGIVDLVGAENIPNVLKKLEANPNLSLMDVSEPVRTVAAGLANNPEIPKAQNIMRSAYEARTGARQDIVQQAVDRTLGPPINVKDYTEQLTENLRSVGKKLIEPALEGAEPVGVKPLVDRLDNIIASPKISADTQERLSRLRKELTVNGEDGFVDPNTLHNIQWPLRAEAENLAKSASGAERNMSKPLFDVRNDLVDAIDNASGGKYKPALSKYRDASLVPEAFDKGFNIMKTGGVEDFPEYWNDWAKNASPQEIAAARAGAISKIRQTVEGMQSGARRGEAVLNPTFIQQRFGSIFTPEQTQKLSGLLEDSKSMAETNSLLYKNSKTAQVTAGQNYFQPREVGSGGAASGPGMGMLGALLTSAGLETPGLIGLAVGGLKTAHTGAQYVGRAIDKATATNFARLASAGSGPSRNELIGLLRSAQKQGPSGNQLLPSMVRLAAP